MRRDEGHVQLSPPYHHCCTRSRPGYKCIPRQGQFTAETHVVSLARGLVNATTGDSLHDGHLRHLRFAQRHNSPRNNAMPHMWLQRKTLRESIQSIDGGNMVAGFGGTDTMQRQNRRQRQRYMTALTKSSSTRESESQIRSQKRRMRQMEDSDIGRS